jgi:Protein of unknown function (DUF3500)
MKTARILLAGVVLASLAGMAYVAQKTETSGSRMVTAAQAFLSSLTAEQKARASFAYDSDERTRWFFTPQQDKAKKATRKGLPLEDMTAEQKKSALALVKAGTSEIGFHAATTIMSLESILKEQEKSGAMVRNPEWYFFTIFGTPAKTGTWGWRVEGHHLSLNFTMDGTTVVAATPSFFGANPAEVKTGPAKGSRILARAEDLAVELSNSFNADQKTVALQPKHFGEPGEKTPSPKVGTPAGLPAKNMTAAQKAILAKLIKSYLERDFTPDLAVTEWSLAKDADLDKVHFAFTGAAERGKGFTYRIQGPTFVIEFLNIQDDSAGNPNNHIHSAYRRIKGDFGLK